MYKVYMIQAGDTIESIARDFNTTVDELRKVNGYIMGLFPGMQIIVPNNEESGMYIVKSGDNLYSISNKYNVSLDSLLSLNGLNKNDYIYPGQEIIIPNSSLEIYTTVENDTLKSIANKLNISIEEIIKENDNIYLEEAQPIKYKRRN